MIYFNALHIQKVFVYLQSKRSISSAYVCGNSFKIIKMITIDNTQYLTIQEYADKFGITIQTVYNRIRDKKLETKKLMGLTLVRL